jgi:hypothetical protein
MNSFSKGWKVAAAAAVLVAAGNAAAADEQPDLTVGPGAAAAAGATTTTTSAGGDDAESEPAEVISSEVPWGFYRDRQGRMMQVSFDFGRRVWLGVGYAPRLRPTGQTEISPAAFDFGAAWDQLAPNGRTRHRFRVLDGQVRLHSFGLDVVGFRYDMSHRYQHPLLRVTTFFREPARRDLYLNVGMYTEAMRFEVAPRGIAGEHVLTLGSVQATLDLWQSADLRSYVRLRVGPGVEMRIGPWGDETRYVGLLPQGTLEGNFIMGHRAMQQLTFRLRGDFLRSASWQAQPLPGDWLANAEAAYEAIIMAINDQPVSLRLAGSACVRDDAQEVIAGVPAARVAWTGMAGIRMSFFAPPVPRPTLAAQ